MIKVRRDRGGVVCDTTTAYDGAGRVTRVATPEGAVNYEYDPYGRLDRTFTTITAGSNPSDDTRYGYDGLGRLKTVSVHRQDGVELTENAYQTSTYGYDLVGNFKWEIRPDGVLVGYAYDALNRLDTLTHYVAGTTPQDGEYLDSVARYDYAVRADGRREGVTETTWFDSTGYGYAEPHKSTTPGTTTTWVE